MSLTPEQCEQFWSAADRNGDGYLTIQELAAALQGFRPAGAPASYKGPSSKDVAVSVAMLLDNNEIMCRLSD